jgi:cobalt-zinc-cadmium efflux system outer membrane protein
LDYTVLHASVTEAPEVRLAGLVVQVREASVELERRRRIPDLTVGAGYRHLNGTDDHAMVFSVSVPWPLFNRNQGNQITAQAQAQQAQAAQQAALRRVRQRLGQLWGEYSGAQAEVLAVESQLLPELDKAFNATMEGYEAGKFAYLETLETQQSLIKARERLISARHKAQKAQLDIEQLLGRSTRNPIP